MIKKNGFTLFELIFGIGITVLGLAVLTGIVCVVWLLIKLAFLT